MMIILIIANILATLFTAYWLTQKSNYQRQIIKDQSDKLNSLKTFTDILEKYINPEDIVKLLDTKKQLMEHDIEIQRRKVITDTSAQMQKEWRKLYDIELKPTLGVILNEFGSFIIAYFSTAHFTDKDERNVHIRLHFPTQADTLIKYFDEVKDNHSESNAKL